MNIIRVESKNDLEEILEHPEIHASNTVFANLSGVIKSSKIPDRFLVYDYQCLMPTPKILNIYFADGITEDYIDQYNQHLDKPEVYFFMNEMVYRMVVYDQNLVIFCSADEKEFEYVKLLGERINYIYGISMISYKKFKKGKRSECDNDIAEIIDFCEKKKDRMIKLLDDLDITLPAQLNMRITKKLLKKLPKKLKDFYKKFVKRED